MRCSPRAAYKSHIHSFLESHIRSFLETCKNLLHLLASLSFVYNKLSQDEVLLYTLIRIAPLCRCQHLPA